MVQVADLLDNLTVALGRKDRDSLIDDIQQWAKTHGREGHLTDETYKNYKSDPNKAAHLAVSLLVLEYLISHERQIKNKLRAQKVRAACSALLASRQKQRFERNAAQEPSADGAAVDRDSGAYALCRMESDIANLCQELVVLAPSEGAERVRYATLIGRNVVMRGHWHLFGFSLCVTAAGYRAGHKPDLMTIAILRSEGGTDLTGGVLTGLTTQNREPVTQSVIIKKIPDIDPNLLHVGNRSDAEIIRQFCAVVPQHLTLRQRKLFAEVHNEIFGDSMPTPESWFDQKVINATERFVAGIRDREDLSRALFPGLLRFCNRRW
jgi:hypothetical protein